MPRPASEDTTIVATTCPRCDNPEARAYQRDGRTPTWYCPKNTNGCGRAGTMKKPPPPDAEWRGPYGQKTNIIIKQCDQCDEWFVRKKKNQVPPRFCSLQCCNNWHGKIKRQRRKDQGSKPRFHIPRDKALAIAYAYGYRCHLCHKLIDVSRKAPHPMSLALDHLIPQTAGGTDAPDNLAPAHKQCNDSRQHTGPAQLQLLGAP